MSEHGAESDALADALVELRLWTSGQRSTNNYIVGTVGDPETERRLIWESDNARIVAIAAEVTALATCVTSPGVGA